MLSPLHVEGRLIKDSFGNTIKLTGTARSHDFKFASPVDEADRLSKLGVNWLRIFVKASMWVDGSYVSMVDDYVAAFTSKNIYCSLVNMENVWADDADPSNLIAFLNSLALRYIDNPGMMGISVWNEPLKGVIGFDTWRIWATLAAESLNAVNPNLIIFVEAGLPNRKGVDTYWVDNRIPINNVYYYFHDYFWMHFFYNYDLFAELYNSSDFESAAIEMDKYFYDNYFKYSVENDFPLSLEEFGFNGGLNPANSGWGNEPGWPQCQIDYTNMLQKYDIPWNEYSWWVKTDQNYGLAEESDFYTLSPVGEIWAQYLTSSVILPEIPKFVWAIIAIGTLYGINKLRR